MYASVRAYRHTHGTERYTVANVYLCDSKYWCMGKIIPCQLGLVASRLCRMAVTRPQSSVAVTLSLSLGSDLLGCINLTREKEKEGKQGMKQSSYIRNRMNP